MLSDKEIVEGCLHSNRSAQKELYDRFIKKMNTVCRRYITDKTELKDVIQDGFIKVFENIQSYRQDGPLEAWIRRIMVNTALTSLRKKKTDLFKNIQSLENQTEINVAPGTETESDDNILEGDFTREELLQMIEELPENYRIVFNLYCIENYSHKEIAEMLSLTEEGSRSRLIRARRMLQENLQQLFKKRLSINK